jgi:hypothetical protein
VSDPWVWVEYMVLAIVPYYRFVQLSPSQLRILPIVTALRLLRISVKFSQVLNDLYGITRAVPRSKIPAVPSRSRSVVLSMHIASESPRTLVSNHEP